MKFVVSLFSILVLGVYCEIFEPCGLAKFLFVNLEEHGSGVLKEIPLLVCVAGYHNFDTDYKGGNCTVRDQLDLEWNKTVGSVQYGYNGIFGLSKSDYIKLQKENSSVAHEALFFLENVIHLDGKPSHPNDAFFRNLCSPEFVKWESCALNDYVRYGFQVPVPRDPGLLTGIKQPSANNSESTENMPASVPKKVPTGGSDLLISFVGYVIESTVFWAIGAVFYLIRPMFFKGII